MTNERVLAIQNSIENNNIGNVLIVDDAYDDPIFQEYFVDDFMELLAIMEENLGGEENYYNFLTAA